MLPWVINTAEDDKNKVSRGNGSPSNVPDEFFIMHEHCLLIASWRQPWDMIGSLPEMNQPPLYQLPFPAAHVSRITATHASGMLQQGLLIARQDVSPAHSETSKTPQTAVLSVEVPSDLPYVQRISTDHQNNNERYRATPSPVTTRFAAPSFGALSSKSGTRLSS
jgi:hypothetical protein